MLAVLLLACPGPAAWGAGNDPLDVGKLSAPPLGSFATAPAGEGMPLPCQTGNAGGPLSLAEVIDRALCNNPQTRAAWTSARVQAAQVGVARSAYLPALTGTLGVNGTRNVANTGITTRFTQESASASASQVLYDFGARDAALQLALESLAASNYALDATLQRVFLAAVQAWYSLFANRAAIEAAQSSEAAAAESLKAATARYAAGVGIPADRLQAQTALSQAVLNRIQAEGNARSAEGVLANVMGLDAHRQVPLAAPDLRMPDERFTRDLAALIDEARRRRPDLAAAEAQVRAAQANVEIARASGLPVLSLTGSLSGADTSIARPANSQSIGVTLSVPLFSGYAPLYRTEAARAQVENQQAQRDLLSQQVALEVWQAHASLDTSAATVRTSADLLASATESEQVAAGRYRAGVGSIIDWLTAQAALANARQQNVQALYNWHVARAALARALGALDAGALQRYRSPAGS